MNKTKKSEWKTIDKDIKDSKKIYKKKRKKSSRNMVSKIPRN